MSVPLQVGLVARNLARLLQSEHRTLLQQLTSGTLQMILRHELNTTMRGRGMHNVEVSLPSPRKQSPPYRSPVDQGDAVSK